MKKKALCLAVAVMMLFGITFTAHAENFTGKAGWKVQFNGDEIQSNFTSADIAEMIYALEPGDNIRISLALENISERKTDWYMTNDARSLEDSQSRADGGAYAYELLYTDGNGKVRVLYRSENVGGEKDAFAGKGLHEAVDSLKEFVYLDHIAPGETGAVSLMVELDGDTQGNSYQNTLAQLQLNFAVEITEEGSIPGSPAPSASAVYSPGTVQTNDRSNIVLWSVLTMVCGLFLMFWGVKCYRRENDINPYMKKPDL